MGIKCTFFIFIILIVFHSSTGFTKTEPLIKNQYNVVNEIDSEKTDSIHKIAILVKTIDWKMKNLVSVDFGKKTEEDRNLARNSAEVAFKIALQKVITKKGYESIFMDGNLTSAYKDASANKCQALLYAEFKWTSGRMFYDEESSCGYTTYRYVENVPMTIGFIEIKDVNNKNIFYKIKYEGHSNVMSHIDISSTMSNYGLYKCEKDIPYIFRIVKESLKEFPVVRK